MIMDLTTTLYDFAEFYMLKNIHKLHFTNNAVNFFLYVISGRKFRSDLIKLLNCKKNKHNDVMVTSNTSTTNASVITSQWRHTQCFQDFQDFIAWITPAVNTKAYHVIIFTINYGITINYVNLIGANSVLLLVVSFCIFCIVLYCIVVFHMVLHHIVLCIVHMGIIIFPLTDLVWMLLLSHWLNIVNPKQLGVKVT